MEDKPNNKNLISLDEELDIKLILKFLLRNKFLIGSVSLVSFLIACIYAVSLKRIWEGQFQIVLNSESNQQQQSISAGLNRIAGLAGVNDLKTEVGILKSPSILEPIFQFVISSKDGKNFSERYSSWKKNLKINLERGTTILNISYRDKDKELIIPVLQKITIAYQDYSGRNKKRNQELTKNYLSQQIELFRVKSSDSLKKAQNYAIEQDLVYFDLEQKANLSIKDMLSGPNLLLPNVGIENVRANAANEIRRIDIQLKKISELNNFEELQYIGSSIPALVAEGLPQTLKDIEQNLAEIRTRYKDNDKNVIELLNKRDLIVDLLKERSIKYLKIARIEAEARMEAAIRPKGVLLKYKELIREAERDETTLITLESQLRLIELDEAKIKDPWELITKPTLLDYPVAPSRRQIGLIGLGFGLFAGIVSAAYKEKKSGKIYDSKYLEKLFKSQIIEQLGRNDIASNSEKIKFLVKFFNSLLKNKLSLICLDNSEEEQNLIALVVNSIDKEKELLILNSSNIFEKYLNSFNYYIIANKNSLQSNEIIKLVERLDLINCQILGIILIT